MMNICVFDTETTSLTKPFCYNVGYVIIDADSWKIQARRSYVVEQIWHNLPLFNSAYYAEKRPIYVNEMRARKTILEKFGYICQQMIRDFKNFQVFHAYAYNSPFDDKVFSFNCDWYKCNNPFDNVQIHDIRGFVHSWIVGDVFKQFCDENQYFTESGNYSTTAETVFRFISGNKEFDEAHTALADAEIEAKILRACLECGAISTEDYPVQRSIEREKRGFLRVVYPDGESQFTYKTMRIAKDRSAIYLR